MSRSHLTVWNRSALLTFATLFAFAALVGDARAACFTPGARHPLPAGKVQFAAAAAAAAAVEDENTPASSVVGLWKSTHFLGTGPDVYDQTYQQFHADGNENMLSRGLPPALGNVCLGTWQRVGPRTFKLKHVAWNWNPDGSFAGTFQMAVTLRLNQSADKYSGTWSAENFDPAGNLIPELNADGIVEATRIGVD